MSGAGPHVLRLAGFSVLARPRSLAICLLLLAVIALLAVALLGSGSMELSPRQVIGALSGSGEDATAARIVRRIRLPGALAAALVGAALGVAGAVFQSISRNALGSPDIIGFTTGAATGAIVQIVLGEPAPFQTALAAVASGILTALLVVALSRRGAAGAGAAAGGYRLVLVGIGMGAVLSGLNTLLMVMGDLERVMSAQVWLSGSLNVRTWNHVLPVALGLAVCWPAILLLSRHAAMIEMGDELAQQLGAAPERTRIALVVLAVILTSVATACTGPIAFVALAGPQIARRLTRAPGLPVVSGGLVGAALLMAAHLLGQRAPLGLNLPIGLTTGVLGGLYLIVLLFRRSR